MQNSTKRVGSRPGPRPQTWVTGPDPVIHAQYRAWVQTRNQAQYRGEIWKITFEQWQQIWTGQWHRRGRAPDALCITRRDMSLPWTVKNAIVITRHEHGTRRRGSCRELGFARAVIL